jgi:hypothetical protein
MALRTLLDPTVMIGTTVSDRPASPVNGSLTVGANAIADAGVLAVGGVGANALFRVVGYLVTANTTGTLQFRWAQNTSDVSDTTVIADSWMRLQRVG